MGRNPLHDVAIIGAYNTKQAKVLQEERELSILLDAMRGALAAASLAPADVDGVNVMSSVERMNSREVVHLLGGRPSWTGSGIGVEAVPRGTDLARLCRRALLGGCFGRCRSEQSDEKE